MSSPVAKANNDFAFRLLGKLSSPDTPRNVFISPYSIHTVLSMTQNGARGETLQAMKSTLGWGRTGRARINQAYADLRQAMEKSEAKVLLGMANSVWIGQHLELMAEFEQRCKEYYAARAEQVNFEDPATRDRINAWIAEKTHERIQDLLKPEHLSPAPVAALVNAIYFKGLWQAPFNPDQTHDAPFTLADGSQKNVGLMHRNGAYGYFEGRDFQIASLLYGEGQFSLEVCLPARSLPLPELLARLDEHTWQRWMDQLNKTEIELGLPRFCLRYEAGLSAPLAALGMQIAFSPQADFSDLCSGQARISNVIHGAFLEVNEEGSEAAAATIVVMQRMGLINRIKPRLIVDRPFFCTIRHRPSETILFMGAVYDPQI